MVLACLNANPPMKIVNMPELNEGFFRGVTADTRQKIEALSKAQNNNNSSSNASAGSKPYVISRNKAIVRLEQKEKLGRLTPREEKMLNYARQQKNPKRNTRRPSSAPETTLTRARPSIAPVPACRHKTTITAAKAAKRGGMEAASGRYAQPQRPDHQSGFRNAGKD